MPDIDKRLTVSRGERVKICLDRWNKENPAKKMTQKSLAEALQLHPVLLSDKLAGRKTLTEYNLRDIAQILGVRVEYLMGLDDYITDNDLFDALIENHKKRYEKRIDALIKLASLRRFEISLDSSGSVIGPSGGYEDIYRIEQDGRRIFVPYTVLTDWIEDISDYVEVKLNRQLKQREGSENNG